MVVGLVLLAAVAALVVAVKLLRPNNQPAKTPESVSKSADDAAHKGIEWIIAHRGQYPETFYFTYLRRFYRITADDDLAKRLLKISRRSTDTAPKCTIDDLASRPEYRNWAALQSVVLQVYQMKCAGKPYRDDADRIQNAISLHEEEFFPLSIPDSRRIVAAFYLNKLGLHFRDSWESIASHIREKAIDPGPVTLDSHDAMMSAYALTHVIFTKSNYYGQYVAASEYGPEMKAMEKYVKAALDEELTSMKMDIAAELVAALKLLKQPMDGDTRALAERLIATQNPDGSWGSEEEATSPTARIHHTGVAVSALLKFTPEPRQKDPWCDSEW
jgi:hypothetical protein